MNRRPRLWTAPLVLLALLAGVGLAAAPRLSRAQVDSAPDMSRPLRAAPRLKPGAVSPVDSMEARRYERTLADPKWEGRGIGTAGIEQAADWIGGRMRAAGLKPLGGNGTWFQSFDVTTGVVAQAPCELRTSGRRDTLGEALQPIGFSTNGTVHARVVFAGYGITAPGYQYDDYAGLDVHDAIVLVMTQEPGELDSTSRFDGNINTPYADLRMKAINAREHGALGLLVVNGPRYHAGEPLHAPASDGEAYMTSGLLAAHVSEAAANALLASAHVTLAAAQAAIEQAQQPHPVALADSATLTVNLRRTRAQTRNVIGCIPGREPMRTLVIGAHYDHLGYGGSNSLAPNEHVPHVGADDNASGVTALLMAAERMAVRAERGWRPRHTLVFVAFTGEEIGLVGSSHFTDDPPQPLESIEAMLNMDMVGRLRSDKLQVMGVGTAVGFDSLVARTNRALAMAHFDLHTSEDGYGPSDHSSFYKRNIPVLFLFTGSHMDYHKPSDTWDKIQCAGLVRVSNFAQALVESLDAGPKPAYRKAKADESQGRIAGGGGYGAYLGTVPDYMQTEGGVLLSGVRAGGPADQAGLRGGDVIVRFDGIRVDNIYDYTFALRSRKPGQDVRITVKRGGNDLDLVATLGRRP